ncbi:MAG: hypothetical protein IT276_09080 [Ignavibacteriaceae bacterium]|nr:hypothetical protein [Ignavibacterium sp.]MCC6255055.1 hypothetical protein [Ignavibacteriaceae bacterium]HRN27140.1 hypothetical protein [Ignavibacteriaceae bacterium]HRP91796.1 hypothetical protein [Ignavibacteriaceae bacterium]HRQ55308.1 hypothetical protein [Ignavibacteriaceae bacterium]
MKKIIFKTFFFDVFAFLLFAFFLFYAGCSCKPCQEQDESQIPLSILKKSDQFIVSKTGDEFFKKYITIDFNQSKHIESNYLMVYKFYMPEKLFVDELIRFTADSTGKVLNQYEVVGIPDCNANQYDCDFVVDENTARQIATEYGLPKGIKDWKVDFVWEAKYNKYVWNLFSTLKENKSADNYRAEGEQIVIDPNNASVIYQNSWKIN